MSHRKSRRWSDRGPQCERSRSTEISAGRTQETAKTKTASRAPMPYWSTPPYPGHTCGCCFMRSTASLMASFSKATLPSGLPASARARRSARASLPMGSIASFCSVRYCERASGRAAVAGVLGNPRPGNHYGSEARVCHRTFRHGQRDGQARVSSKLPSNINSIGRTTSPPKDADLAIPFKP
jgi:hypothetical protein